ncbi:hypothetical protein BC332_00628 [Capsicum chinense]|nr:hypothetical protein BC332_00628 [Capsicum chinense]
MGSRDSRARKTSESLRRDVRLIFMSRGVLRVDVKANVAKITIRGEALMEEELGEGSVFIMSVSFLDQSEVIVVGRPNEVVKVSVFIEEDITNGSITIILSKGFLNYASNARQMGGPTVYKKFNHVPLIYPPNKYERDAKKYWDIFYKRHQDKFFKDRHYLDKEWGQYFSGTEGKVILEVGCGAGNTIFPLLATMPNIFVHACDFSPRAVNLVKSHKDFDDARVNAFVCDPTVDDLIQHISPSSVDVVTMIFVLSAVSPEKMPLMLQNIRKILKKDGCVLFRDYAVGDLAQERLTSKEQKISDNFYVRGDGTRAFYFSDEFLVNLFNENGFDAEEHILCFKQVENRSRELVMNRIIFDTITMEPEASNAQTMDNNAINLILARLETMSRDMARLNVGLEKLDTDVASMSGRIEHVESQRSRPSTPRNISPTITPEALH